MDTVFGHLLKHNLKKASDIANHILTCSFDPTSEIWSENIILEWSDIFQLYFVNTNVLYYLNPMGPSLFCTHKTTNSWHQTLFIDNLARTYAYIYLCTDCSHNCLVETSQYDFDGHGKCIVLKTRTFSLIITESSFFHADICLLPSSTIQVQEIFTLPQIKKKNAFTCIKCVHVKEKHARTVAFIHQCN